MQKSVLYIGLERVENVSVDDACPTFTESKTNDNINSGDTASILWGKVKKHISVLITHIANKDNPHGVTTEKINAAKSVHNHSTSDINSGILSVARGGTGVSDLNSLLKKLITDGKQHIKLANGRYLRGLSTNGKEYTLIGMGTDNNVYVGNDECAYTHLHAKNNICFKTQATATDSRYWGLSSTGAFYPYRIINAGSTQVNSYSSIGTSNRRVANIYASNSLNTSDAKLKENITDAEIGLEILKRLSIVQFNFIGEKDLKCGVIAQEVYKLFQELGIHNSGVYQASGEEIYHAVPVLDNNGVACLYDKVSKKFEYDIIGKEAFSYAV